MLPAVGQDGRYRAPGAHLTGLKYPKGEIDWVGREGAGSERGGFGLACALVIKYLLGFVQTQLPSLVFGAVKPFLSQQQNESKNSQKADFLQRKMCVSSPTC